MKSKGIILLLITNILIPHVAFAINFKSDNYYLRYHFLINQKQRGYMWLNKGQNEYHSKYLDIHEYDRIPFFYPSKSGKFENDIYATEMTFQNIRYVVYNNLDKAPQSIQTYIKGDKSTKSVLANNEGLPKLIIDKIPMVTIENIIIGFIQGGIKKEQEFILYEEGSKAHFRIYFENVGKNRTNVGNTSCEVYSYECKRKGLPDQTDKTIFHIDVSVKTGVPVRISSISGRWIMILQGIGKPTQKMYDQTDDYIMIAQKRLTEFFKPRIPQITIRDRSINDRDDFSFLFDAFFPVKFYDDFQLAAKYFYTELSKKGHPKCIDDKSFNVNSIISGLVNGKPVFFLFASNREICTLLSQNGYNDVRCNTTKFSDYIPGVGLTRAIGSEILDMIDDKPSELKTRKKNEDLFDQYGTKAILSKLGDKNAECIDINIVKEKIIAISEGYALVVYQQELNRYRQDLIRLECQSIKAKKGWRKTFLQGEDVCLVAGSDNIHGKEDEMTRLIIRKYPDLQYFGVHNAKKEKQFIIFNYIPERTGF